MLTPRLTDSKSETSSECTDKLPQEKGVGGKLVFAWRGPDRVVKVINPVTYVLTDKEGKMLPGTTHARQMTHAVV